MAKWKWATWLVMGTLHLWVPATAAAFCGFYVSGGDASLYNDATQVVLMREGQTTVLSMQNNYQGPPADFAMVVPVPQILKKSNVKVVDHRIFERVDHLSAPRLVEYWEQNPCERYGFGGVSAAIGIGGLGMSGFGRGGGGMGSIDGYVKVKSKFRTGEYEIVILDTNDAAALDGWLKDNGYKIPDGAESYFQPYIDQGDYFFVAKVDIERVRTENGRVVLSPLRFHYTSPQFTLPIRLGMINAKGHQDLLAYILSPSHRFEVANYKSVTIPTNLALRSDAKDDFAGFYEALFARTMKKNPGAVVTEYAWSAQKCDPCPSGLVSGAALSTEDLTALGGDVLRPQELRRGNTTGWVLTRLHTRYQKDEIGADLVFRQVEGIAGGRQVFDETGDLETSAQPTQTNNFQGRYIVYNRWQGDIACKQPIRNRWQGPPDIAAMTMSAEAVVAHMRLSKTKKRHRRSDAEEPHEPWSAKERRAVSRVLRKRFGTSEFPSLDGGSDWARASQTRNARERKASKTPLEKLVAEPIPELDVDPTASRKQAPRKRPKRRPGARPSSSTNHNLPATSAAVKAPQNLMTSTLPLRCTSALGLPHRPWYLGGTLILFWGYCGRRRRKN